MIQAISFGNSTQYVTEGTIFAKKEAQLLAERMTRAIKSDIRRAKEAKAEYTSPFANYSTNTKSAFPNYPSPEMSYAVSHNSTVGQNLNIVSK